MATHWRRRTRRRIEIVLATHRWRPDHIALAASGRTIYVDPDDPRGWEIIRGLGRGHQPALISLWQRAAIALRPDLVIDVGANYGEMLLNGDYGGATALALEPNPKVAALLRRSVAAHPEHATIVVHEAAATDADGGSVTLQIDPAWSGSASLAELGVGRAGDAPIAVDVPAHTIDSLTRDLPSERVLLKVDAEGWEAGVLSGAAELLSRCSRFVAILEFDPTQLRRAGTDPDALHRSLLERGSCWQIDHAGRSAASVDTPVAACDLLVCDDTELGRAILRDEDGPPASTRGPARPPV